MSAAVLVVVLLVGLLFAAGLYALVRAEHDQRERMTREDAERAARRDEDDR